MRQGKGMGWVSTILHRIEVKTILMRWHLSSDVNDVMKRATGDMNIQVQRPRCGSLLGAFKEHLDYLGGKCDHNRVRKVK